MFLDEYHCCINAYVAFFSAVDVEGWAHELRKTRPVLSDTFSHLWRYTFHQRGFQRVYLAEGGGEFSHFILQVHHKHSVSTHLEIHGFHRSGRRWKGLKIWTTKAARQMWWSRKVHVREILKYKSLQFILQFLQYLSQCTLSSLMRIMEEY